MKRPVAKVPMIKDPLVRDLLFGGAAIGLLFLAAHAAAIFPL